MRLVVGFHFFVEGSKKIQDPNWTAEYFLRGAKGPAAPLFHQMLEDESGTQRLCIVKVENEETKELEWQINPEITILLWENFLDAAAEHYGFNNLEIIDELSKRREKLAQQIQDAREAKDKSTNTRELEAKRAADEQAIIAIRNQIQDADQIYKDHLTELNDWLDYNRTELLAHFNTEERLNGFERDGKNSQKVAVYVESLRNQVVTIQGDRQKQLATWFGEIEAMWDSFESKINQLAVGPQTDQGQIALHRPFDQKNSKLKMVDRIIPWFDTIVGALLILGLFTRFASLSAGLFLLSVIISQPPWIPGTQETIYQAIEMFALFAIFATCAGRFGGLDFFLSQSSKQEGQAVEA